MSKKAQVKRPAARLSLSALSSLMNSQAPPAMAQPRTAAVERELDDASIAVAPVDLLNDAWAEYAEIDLSLIDVDPKQPRQTFDSVSIAELAETIKAQGLLQPIAVRPHPSQTGRYMLISGERRVRACRSLGNRTIQARVMPVDERTVRALQLIENSEKARKAVAPWEEAQFIAELVTLLGSQAAVVAETGMPKDWISKRMALLDIPSPIKEMVQSRELTDHESILGLKRLHGINPDEAKRVCKLISGQQSGQRKTIYAELKVAKAQHRGLSQHDDALRGAAELQHQLQEVLAGTAGKSGKITAKIETNARGYAIQIQVPRLDQITELIDALRK